LLTTKFGLAILLDLSRGYPKAWERP